MEWNDLEISRREYLIKADLAGAKLAGADLGGADGGHFGAGADLTGANLRGADLAGANLVEVNFSCADLTGANLKGAVLGRSHFTAAILDGACFDDADFVDPNAHSARAVRTFPTELRSASLIGATFVRAKLWWTRFHRSDLTEADFSSADVRGASFRECNLTSANFAGTKFPDPSDRVDLMSGLRSVDFEGSVLASVDLSRLKEVWLDLRGTDVSDSDLVSVDVSEVTFLTHQEWSDNEDELWDQPSVSLAGVDFSGATISWSNLRGIVYENGEVFDTGGDGYEDDLRKPSDDELTVWPEGFDPVTAGVTFE